jgi:hypothetical protein
LRISEDNSGYVRNIWGIFEEYLRNIRGYLRVFEEYLNIFEDVR